VLLTAVVLVGALVTALVPNWGSPASAKIVPALAVDVTGTTGTHGVVTLATVEKAAAGAIVSVRTLAVGPLTRAYVVVAPEITTTALPLLVVLQGVDASATLEMQRDELLPLAVQGKAIVVYPVAYGESWNVGVDQCCKQAAAANVNDQAFIRAVTQTVEASEPVNPQQVHLVGFSNGGKLAYQIMCDQPTLFTDFAVLSAVPLAACTAKSQPAKSVLITIGSADDDLPQTGKSQPIADIYPPALAVWQKRDACVGGSTVRTAPPLTTTAWATCSAGTVVVGVEYAGLAHVWPTSANVGAAVSGAAIVWSFVSGQLGRNNAG
jgi:polyhydroxybutyrate depolymerase